MDSAFEVHGGALSAAAAMVRPAKQSLAPPAYWPSAPLPVPDGVTRGASGSSSQLEDALAQHMLLLDLEEPDDGSPPQQLPQQQGGMAARRKLGPVTPNGFTPAEAYVDRQERTVFFAKCAPSASADAVARVFSAYGEVEEINVFRSWPSAKASRGCGLVVMATPQGAAAAIEGLHHKYLWEGVSAPMVVERCCAARLGVKAATQSATRARRTAAAHAARRAARAGAAWQAAIGGAGQVSCPIAALSLHHHAHGGAGGNGLMHSAPLGALPGLTIQQQLLLQQQAAAAAAQQQQQQQQQQHQQQQHQAQHSQHLGHAAGALGSADDVRDTYSAPLPVVRHGSHTFNAGTLNAGTSPPYGGAAAAAASAAGLYGATPPGAVSGRLPSPVGNGVSGGAPGLGLPASSPQDLGLGAAMGAALGGLLPPRTAAMSLSQPLPAPLQLPLGGGGGAGSGGEAPCCPLSLQSPEQVQVVLEHAATLSALSGASIWLKPEPGGAPGTGLALSGSPAQLQAAAALISQLLSVAGGAAASAGAGWAC